MSNYNVFKYVDYITLSVYEFQPLDDVLGQPKHRKPTLPNYKECHIYDCGLLVQWHYQQKRLKKHITLSGATMAIIREYGYSDVDILYWLSSMANARFGRIDIAITSSKKNGKKHGFKPKTLHNQAIRKLNKSRIELDKPVVDKNLKVETCYIGNRETRNRLFRAYDYGLNNDELPDYTIRYELESRKSAYNVVQRIMRGHDMGGIMRSVIDFPENRTWVEIMGSEPLPNLRSDNQLSEREKEIRDNENRWHWLLTSVAPAMGKALAMDEYHEIESKLDTFNKMVEYFRVHAISEKLDMP